jgi:hypothetical protein
VDRLLPIAHTLFVMEPALYRIAALGAVLAAVPAQAQSPVFANVVQSRYVHCAFYKAYDVDRVTGDHVLVEGRSDTLTHFQGIEGDRARQITTRTAGARDVRVVHTGKYLHFIDRMAGMYVLTTIYDCIDRDRRGICVTYGAMQSRHFDARVLSDPDAVYEALRDNSDPGFCDHSFFGMQEAAR